MPQNLEPLENLVDQFARFPGIGRKGATRMAYEVMGMSNEQAMALSKAIEHAKTGLHRCRLCQDYTPGEKVTLHFETGSVVCQLNPGDYIRVDISSSAEGMYSLHTNVKGNQWEIAEPKIANNTVYTGISSITYYTEDLAA